MSLVLAVLASALLGFMFTEMGSLTFTSRPPIDYLDLLAGRDEA